MTLALGYTILFGILLSTHLILLVIKPRKITFFWNFVHQQQILHLLPLLNVQLPAYQFEFQKQLVMTFIYSFGNVYNGIRNAFGYYDSDITLIDFLANYGFRSLHFLGNIGLALILIVMTFLLIVTIYISQKIKAASPFDKFILWIK